MWQYVSRYEGDLVAKCYFAKHKLVWEVLDGGLKSKIEIQWSDIMALKANCPDNGPGTLNVVVMLSTSVILPTESISLFLLIILSSLLRRFSDILWAVQLARQPLFFRETNPQPRKHTLWQATADFTNGQASIHRYCYTGICINVLFLCIGVSNSYPNTQRTILTYFFL